MRLQSKAWRTYDIMHEMAAAIPTHRQQLWWLMLLVYWVPVSLLVAVQHTLPSLDEKDEEACLACAANQTLHRFCLMGQPSMPWDARTRNARGTHAWLFVQMMLL